MQHLGAYLSGKIFCQDAGKGFASSKIGQRYAYDHAVPETSILGQTSWVITTPTFMLYQTGASSRAILSRMVLTQTGTVAGDDVGVAIVIDSTVRYSAGGTLVVGKPMTMGKTTAANLLCRTLPTAAAASAARSVFSTGAIKAIGGVLDVDFGDAIQIEGTGAILIYTWATTTGPTLYFHFEAIEEAL